MNSIIKDILNMKSFNPPLRTYGTTHEMDFLSKLGSFSKDIGETRLELLLSYQKAMRLRFNWDNIDKEKIKKHVIKLIKDEPNE